MRVGGGMVPCTQECGHALRSRGCENAGGSLEALHRQGPSLTGEGGTCLRFAPAARQFSLNPAPPSLAMVIQPGHRGRAGR